MSIQASADEWVAGIAKKTLDAEYDEVPKFYLPLLAEFLVAHPDDDNFIVEFADEGNPSVGGIGYGTITCMEDGCWQDINLDRDMRPVRPDGGKADGFGSFYNYAMHCENDQTHREGRETRLAKLAKYRKTPVKPRPSELSSSSFLSALDDVLPNHSSPIAPKTEPGQRGEPSRVLKPSNSVNLVNDSKPFFKSSQGSFIEPIEIDSASDDDDVQLLPPSQIPKDLRKTTNKENPFELSDDEGDIAGPSSSAHIGSSSQAKQPLAPIFAQTAKAKPRNPFARPAAGSAYVKSETASASQGPLKPETDTERFRALLNGEVDEDKKPKAVVERKPVIIQTSWYEQEYARACGRLSGSTSLAFKINPLPDQEKRQGVLAERQAVIATFNSYYRRPRATAYLQALTFRLTQLNGLVNSPGTTAWVSPSLTVLMIMPELKQLWERLYGPAFSSPISAADVAPPAPSSTFNSLVRGLASTVNRLSSAALHNAAAGPSSQPYPTGSLSYNDPSYTAYAQYIPGQFPHDGINGAVAIGGALGDEPDWGYEADRPATTEGLTNLFQTALDDFQEDVTVDEAIQALGMEKLDSQMEGLNITLMPHQVIGVHWMLKQEKKDRIKGGILGDEMGLGKTVQAIAAIVQNPSQDRKIRTTLIVLPVPLLQQWKSEIVSKSGLTALIYHGPNRTKSANQLREYDCVLTTYSILVAEGSDLIQKPKKKKKDPFVSDDDDDVPPPPKRKGPLFKVAWYRIILDEAANIRNKSTKMSKLVHELSGEIRWCLTGTLIYNTLTDLYPLLAFVGVIDWEEFRIRIHSIAARRPKLAAKRSQAILRRVMLRRTKESELHGKKILQLPPKTVEMVELDFTDEERAIYNAVENAARVKVNSWYRAGTILKHYHVVLVMLTRLRQLCCHPYLLRATADAMAHMGVVTVDDEDDAGLSMSNTITESADDASEVERATLSMGQDWVDKLKSKLEERYANMAKDNAENDESDFNCAVCLEPYTQERVTACHHSFCTQCIQDVLNAPIRDATGMSEEQVLRQVRLCPLCRSEVTRDKLFRADAFYKPEEEKAELEDVKPSRGLLDGWLKGDTYKNKKRMMDDDDEKPDIKKVRLDKGKGKAKASDSDEEEDEEVEPLEDDSDELGIEDVKPSTKMRRIGDLLDKWREVDPTQKTLIFSSFVEMLELLAQYLKRKGIKYVLYTGKLKTAERDEAIKKFTSSQKQGPTVMLISLKCGGVGLNLTAANKVIGLDLAWSPAAESQAVDRAHRIGQTRNVSVKRLIIRNSVEERILALQEKKQALADGAMGEGDGGRLGRLSAHDLIRLFGSETDD